MFRGVVVGAAFVSVSSSARSVRAQPPAPPAPVSPSPAPEPTAEATDTNADEERRARVGILAGGLVLPGVAVSAVAGGVMVNFRSPQRGWEPRLFGIAYYTADEHTHTTGAVLLGHESYWFSVYGLGFGAGFGYASFDKVKGGGWNDSSFQVVVYASPVLLRFGKQPRGEVGLNAGATRFVTHDIRPFGYLYGGVIF